jgi:hypothetical protein
MYMRKFKIDTESFTVSFKVFVARAGCDLDDRLIFAKLPEVA